MPHQEHSHRFQSAVYWPKEGVDRYGEPLRGDAVEVRVRWDPNRRLLNRPDGSSINVDASLVMNSAVVEGSLMWLGRLAELSGTGFTFVDAAEAGVMEVVSCDVTPDVKNRVSAFMIGLKRFRGELPAELV